MPRIAGLACELTIGDRLAEADCRDRFPYRVLKRRAIGRCGRFESRPLATEILGQLALRLPQRRMAGSVSPFICDCGMIFLAFEIDAGYALVVGDEQHAAVRAFKKIVIAHT